MRYASLWSPGWSTGAVPAPDLVAAFLEVVPRVVVEGRGVVWADLRGLDGERGVASLLELAEEVSPGVPVRAGLAAVPVVAEMAARSGAAPVPCMVEAGREREFLAPLPLSLLASTISRSSGPVRHLLSLLDGVGLHCCGELAALDQASVEVRFGADGVRLWRLARGDDERLLFPPIPPERPHASLDFIDYLVTDPERLVFTINALLESVTAALRARGEHARRLLLTLSLANGREWRRALRPARPTASREVWLRLVRGLLERSEIPDAVAGVAVEVEATEPATARQGDLFDRGFATAGAVEAALARLLESQGEVVVAPRYSGHPLPERRVVWEGVDPFRQVDESQAGGTHLSLHLLSEPQPIDVETGVGSAHGPPIRYRDRTGWQRVVNAAGPDRISGGQWEEEPFAREYFRCVTEGGALVWLYRDARRGTWFLHGWWG